MRELQQVIMIYYRRVKEISPPASANAEMVQLLKQRKRRLFPYYFKRGKAGKRKAYGTVAVNRILGIYPKKKKIKPKNDRDNDNDINNEGNGSNYDDDNGGDDEDDDVENHDDDEGRSNRIRTYRTFSMVR